MWQNTIVSVVSFRRTSSIRVTGSSMTPGWWQMTSFRIHLHTTKCLIVSRIWLFASYWENVPLRRYAESAMAKPISGRSASKCRGRGRWVAVIAVVLRWWSHWRTVPTSSATTRPTVTRTASSGSGAAASVWWRPCDTSTAPSLRRRATRLQPVRRRTAPRTRSGTSWSDGCEPTAFTSPHQLFCVCRDILATETTSIGCRRRTRATRCITADVLQTEADAQCDKLVDATKLTTLATVDVFEL